jgi:hypothetical protein
MVSPGCRPQSQATPDRAINKGQPAEEAPGSLQSVTSQSLFNQWDGETDAHFDLTQP